MKKFLLNLKDDYKKDKIIIFNVFMALLSTASYQLDFVHDNFPHYYLYFLGATTLINSLIKNYENVKNKDLNLSSNELINNKAPNLISNDGVVEKIDKQNFNSGSC